MTKNYIITGASSGIGEACVKLLANENTRQIIIGRNTTKLNELSSELPGEIIPITYDLENLSDIKTVFEPCSKKGFKLDGMVYCAGIDGTWPIKANSLETMQKIMTVNCFAFVEMCKHFYSKRISNDDSSIVAISSIASLTAEKGMVAYSMSKGALNVAVKTASKEFARRRIRGNAILPAGVQTPMADAKGELLSGIDSSTESAGQVQENPQPYGMIPRENIAEQVLYLLSDKTNYITGETLVVGAGMGY